MKYVVSACLAGEKCRYDANSKPYRKIIALVENNEAIAVCPEILGGLCTPRPACEKKENKIISETGEDMTPYFEKCSKEALKIALDNNCIYAILKSKSPSCGYGKVYDGNFNGNLIAGNGMFAQVLKKNGIKIKTEEDFED